MSNIILLACFMLVGHCYAAIPGGAVNIDDVENNDGLNALKEEIKTQVFSSLRKQDVNKVSDSFGYIRILKATSQVVAGVDYKIKALLGKNEHEGLQLCTLNVWRREWLKSTVIRNVNCHDLDKHRNIDAFLGTKPFATKYEQKVNKINEDKLMMFLSNEFSMRTNSMYRRVVERLAKHKEEGGKHEYTVMVGNSVCRNRGKYRKTTLKECPIQRGSMNAQREECHVTVTSDVTGYHLLKSSCKRHVTAGQHVDDILRPGQTHVGQEVRGRPSYHMLRVLDLSRLIGRQKRGDDVTCPGGQSSCPSEYTCCLMGTGQYGCCPLPKAVCCKDHVHCCPHGYSCDVTAGTCTHGTHVTRMAKKLPATPTSSNITCPDKSSCPAGDTCCEAAGGAYACCPMPSAVCCSDHLHCCPHGTTCHLSTGTCAAPAPALQTTAVALQQNAEVKCKDNSTCSPSSTCCRLSTGAYGCCLLPYAVCCKDGVHCCPKGYRCDIKHNMCQLDFVAMVTSVKPRVKAPDTFCPGHKISCGTGQTCCKLAAGGYGCCPLPHAVCCSDGIHCCPEHRRCDTKEMKCVGSDGSVSDMLRKVPGVPRGEDMELIALPETGAASDNVPQLDAGDKVICPDGTQYCEAGQTCCSDGKGQYNCCPLTQAVCCADHIHCCPHASHCGKLICQRQGAANPFSWRTPAKRFNNEIKKHRSNPQLIIGETHSQDSTLRFQPRTEVVRDEATGDIICDSDARCPARGHSCSRMAGGAWGCCPHEGAVTCSDGVHCCPAGSTCDAHAQMCRSTSDSLAISWTAIRPRHKISFALHGAPRQTPCPDGSACRAGTTCCPTLHGQYRCCPLTAAVCCADKVHCCPQGMKCRGRGVCYQGNWQISAQFYARYFSTPRDSDTSAVQQKPGASRPWLTKTAALKQGSVKCDELHYCPSMMTCCRLPGGQWGCCPAPQAVCCRDHVHCCRHGEQCTDQGTCEPQP